MADINDAVALKAYMAKKDELVALVAASDNGENVVVLANALGVSVDDVIQMAEDANLCIDVALSSGGGIYGLEPSEYIIEYV